MSYVCLLWLIQLLTAGTSEDYTEQVNYEDSQSICCEVLQYYLQKHSGLVFLLVQGMQVEGYTQVNIKELQDNIVQYYCNCFLF